MSDQTMRAVGILTARVILGLIFGMAGYWKTFELTPIGHAQKLFIVPYANTWIPISMLWATGTIIPVVELVAGWMVVVGWRVRECLVALGLILITVTYGHLLIEPLYNFNGHVIPRTLLLLVVAFMPRDADWYSLDYWLERQPSLAGQARRLPTIAREASGGEPKHPDPATVGRPGGNGN